MSHFFLARLFVLVNVFAVAASAQITTTFDRTLTTPSSTRTSVERCVARADGGFYAVLWTYVVTGSTYGQDQGTRGGRLRSIRGVGSRSPGSRATGPGLPPTGSR